MRFRVAPLVLGLLTAAAVGPAQAQLRASRPPTAPKNLPRLLIANPHSFQAADSAAAVRLGTGMREKIEGVADKWYNTIQRTQMNDALIQYGYPPDAVLPPLVARQLGTQLQARAIVVGTLTRGEGGRVSVEARLLAGNDQTGHMVTMAQAAGQSFEDLGAKLGESFRGAFTALQESKNCDNLAATQPDKAIEAANKALKAQPNHGPAALCLAQIGIAKKAPADQIIGHLKSASLGDRLSVEVLGGLLGQYQAKGDTVNVVDSYRQLILVAPNNQKVVEEAIRYFIAAGKSDLGEQIAQDAIGRDPSNPDMHNLLATACLVQDKAEKNLCAIKAMEMVFTLDTAKADTFNLAKVLYVASRDSSNGAVYVKWGQFAAKKFPANASLLNELVKGYELTGPVDSAVAVARRLIEVDKVDMSPVIRSVRALLKEKRFREAVELGALVEQNGQDNDKANLGSILAQEGGLPILQTQPIDFPLAAEIGKKAAGLLRPGGRAHQLASYVLGFGLLGQLSIKDTDVVNTKSCDAVNILDAWIVETKAALTAGQPIQPAEVGQRIQALDAGYGPRIAQMKKAYCKGN